MLVCIFQHHGSHMGKWRNVRPPKPFWLEAHPRNRYTEWVTMWASPQSQMSWLNKSHLTIVKKNYLVHFLYISWISRLFSPICLPSHHIIDCFHQYACHHTTSSIPKWPILGNMCEPFHLSCAFVDLFLVAFLGGPSEREWACFWRSRFVPTILASIDIIYIYPSDWQLHIYIYIYIYIYM